MRKVWIVVANSAVAKIYTAENTHTLKEHRILTHKASREHSHNLTSDAPGKMGRNGRYGLDVVEERVSPQEKEVQQFAHEVATFLDQGCTEGLCERIYLVAKAPFLGYVREALSPRVVKMIASEVHKDIVDFSPEKIRTYLPPVL